MIGRPSACSALLHLCFCKRKSKVDQLLKTDTEWLLTLLYFWAWESGFGGRPGGFNGWIHLKFSPLKPLFPNEQPYVIPSPVLNESFPSNYIVIG